MKAGFGLLPNTWEILFFDAWLKCDVRAGKLLYEGNSIEGVPFGTKTHQRTMDKPTLRIEVKK